MSVTQELKLKRAELSDRLEELSKLQSELQEQIRSIDTVNAIEVLYTLNSWEPYYVRVWHDGQSENLGFFSTWKESMDYVAGIGIEDGPFVENIAGIVTQMFDGETQTWFVGESEADEISNYTSPSIKLIRLEDMREPEWKNLPGHRSAPRI